MRFGRKTSAFALLGTLVATMAATAEQEPRERGPEKVPFEVFQLREQIRTHAALMGGAGFETNSNAGGLQWTDLGPRPITSDYWSGGDPVSGRVSAVMVDPRDSNRVYIAAAQGGVWKSTDGGSTWNPLTDHLSSLASGALAHDPVNPDIIYYGTGEQHLSGDSFYGDGVFRSTDQGATWSQIASRVAAGSYIARVVVHPAKPDTVYLASSRGVVRTTDGGTSWLPTLQVWCTDLVVSPLDGNRVFAAGYGSGLYRSTDAGNTWGILAGGLPTTGFFRINLAIAPSNPDVLYASFVAGSGALLGMYRTSDGGNTWSLLPTTPNYLGNQGWYDNCVIVDPTNPNICYAAGNYPYLNTLNKGVIRTTNGGTSWSDITHDGFGNAVHPDQHHMTFGPDGRLWVACDGGVWKRTANNRWLHRNQNLGITQFYTVGLHPTDPNQILGGTQDNGTAIYYGTLGWPQLIAGDGGPVAYEWATPEYMYSTYVRMNPLYRWHGGGLDLDATGPWETDGDPADWANGPLEVDPNVVNTLWVGTHRVWKSTDRGLTWTDLSGDIGGGGVLLSMGIARTTLNTVYAGTSTGIVRFTADGVTWALRNGGLPPAPVTDIHVDPNDASIAFLSMDIASGARVFRTADYGMSWQSVTGNLPNDRRGLSLEADFRLGGPRLYLGTDYGVYASPDGGVTWARASDGLPNLAIYDLALDTVNDYLVAATHGRGMWRAYVDMTAPEVSVTAANGGEGWPVEFVRHIQWSTQDAGGVDTVAIFLSRDGGATWPETLAHGIDDTGDFTWVVTGPFSTQCRLRVRAWDLAGNVDEDESDANFTIGPQTLDVNEAMATGVALLPIAPNPGRAPFAFRFELTAASDVSVQVFDASGRRVRAFASEQRASGPHVVTWDGRDDADRVMGDGVYWALVRAAGVQRTRRFVLLR